MRTYTASIPTRGATGLIWRKSGTTSSASVNAWCCTPTRTPNPARIAHGVAAIYNSELVPVPPAAIADKEPQVTALAKELIGRAATGTLESGSFTAEAWTETSRSAAQVGAFLKTLGPLNVIELLERSEQDGNRIYRYRLRYKDSNLFFVMVLTKESKIARLNLQPE